MNECLKIDTRFISLIDNKDHKLFNRVESLLLEVVDMCESKCCSQKERDIVIEDATLELLTIYFNFEKNDRRILFSFLEFIKMTDVDFETHEEMDDAIVKFIMSDFL